MQQYWEQEFANMMLGSSNKPSGASKLRPALEDGHGVDTDDGVDFDDS